jgi:two-component system OmpR family sensor kinase
MSRPYGLSLRGRLLVLQVAVAAVLLLILGVVSTALFVRPLTRQFDATILAQSTRSPADIAGRPAGATAVLVTFRPFNVLPLTASPATSELVHAVNGLTARQVIGVATAGRVFPLQQTGGGPALYIAARLVPRPERPRGRPSVVIVADQVSALTNELRGLILIELATGAMLLVVLAVGGQWLIGRGLRPLDRMARTANEITARGDLTARMAEADEQSEVGRLGTAINSMLGRIQQAFGARLQSERKVREFAADASHELRTPLTTIRGYAELYRQGALGPDQLPGAMRRIEQEARRMSILVAELLELARLDRTSSLDLAETDLAAVVRDAVADALAVEPDRVITADAPPRLLAVVDEPRIRQVLANLLANVRTHTPVSAPVAVRLGAVTGGVLVEVADGGPGMSPLDTARAFDRFHRADGHGAGGDAGRGEDNLSGAGSGLGLSIVQAIAAAHGGQATLDSWAGEGTRVRVWLPARSLPAA